MSGVITQHLTARRSERNWVEGVRALRQGDTTRASALFSDVVHRDPSASDAWLGLHALGVRQSESLTAMSHHAGSFGMLRKQTETPLASRFGIGEFTTFRLETHRDLWLAGLASLLDAGQLDSALRSLSRAVLDCDETRFVTTRHAYLARDWENVLGLSRGIVAPHLHEESQLYVARALLEQGVLHEGLRLLQTLPEVFGTGSHFHAEVAYWSGVAYAGLGDAEEALRQYQYAFRFWPGLYDVAERAGARKEPRIVSGAARVATAVAGGQEAAPDPRLPADSATRTVGSPELLAEARAELDGMIGLGPVKDQVRTMIAQLQMAALRAEQGIACGTQPQHFVFSGPPGTGKTTVARIVGKIFTGLGLLSKGHVVETQRVDLVGQHLGSTALKTTAVIDSAMDGVLFVDEAYALHNDGYHGGDAFGDEAVQVLLKRAEDDRDRLVVVLAGYQEEMQELLLTNPGLASRFTTRVEFPSYTPEELQLIAMSLASSSGDVLSEAAEELLRRGLQQAGPRIDNLGNARFVRNLHQKASASRDLRLTELAAGGLRLDRTALTTIEAEDMAAALAELLGAAESADEEAGSQLG